jgi:hypothetical protein
LQDFQQALLTTSHQQKFYRVLKTQTLTDKEHYLTLLSGTLASSSTTEKEK